MLKISFQVELYDEMIGQPFNKDDYLACRLTILLQKNGNQIELCNSTFHDALLLSMGEILLDLAENRQSASNTFETFENPMEYTLVRNGHSLIIKAYNEYDKSTEIVFQGEFEAFFKAFFKEYEHYFKRLCKEDSQAREHESVAKMEKQLMDYKNLVSNY